MTETPVEQCLRLCREVLESSGETQTAAMAALQSALCALHDNCQPVKPASDESPLIGLDMAGYITRWNDAARTLFGYTASEAIGQHVLFLYADESVDESHELFLEHGCPLMEVRRRKKNGEVFRANLALRRILDDEGLPVAMEARLTEIGDRLSPEERLQLHARIIEDSDQGILIVDATEHIVSVNAAFTRITGYSAGEAIGETPDLLRSGVHSTDFRAQVRSAMHGSGAWQGEIIGKRKNGEIFPQSVSIGVTRNVFGEVTHAFSIFSDISVLRATEERMQRLVNYDSLTGLPNRTLFHQLVEQALSSARRNNGHGALMVIDLNRFTSINDTLGHDVGDELLRQVGERFRQSLREEDILARVGGDEFVVGLVNIQKKEHSALVADKLIAMLEAPFIIDSHALHIGASIGIAVYPEDALDTAGLIRAADVAMKRKQAGGESGYLFFSPEMNQRAREQWQLEGELRKALTGHQLLLHYQPKVSLRSGRIVGAEALIRWSHPQRGAIPPARFIPLAEETGLILDIGYWVFHEACRQINAWSQAGLPLVPIALNLSARQFDAQLPRRLREIVQQHQVACELIKLEITESLLVRGPEKVIPIMNELAAMGFTLALDDFGTGYSSLAYLKKFPISTLKIDRSFVIGVPDDENDCAIAQAIVTMGKQLRQEIVAEGIETPEQMAFLRKLGCDQLQGYLFSPPVAADQFAQMLREGKRLTLEIAAA